MYCKKCGNRLEEGSDICLMCGQRQNAKIIKDTGTKWWGVLGFFFPIIGLILFILWRQDEPLNSKYAGIGALVSVISGIFFVIFYILCIIIAVSMGLFYN